MSGLSSRSRNRFAPTLEALEDRFLLSADVVGPGQIVTTGLNNTVAILDDGNQIQVFTGSIFGSPLVTFQEGTNLSLRTSKAGSTNLVTYDLLGTGPHIASLDVNFGSGTGSLTTNVVDNLGGLLGAVAPGVVPGGLVPGKLADTSDVQITAEGGRSIRDVLNAGSVGASVLLTDSYTGGTGAAAFAANLGVGGAGTAQGLGSQVVLTFKPGGTGLARALVSYQETLIGELDITLDAKHLANLRVQASMENGTGVVNSELNAPPGSVLINQITGSSHAAQATASVDGVPQPTL
jgi:hypothetical protein